MLQLYSLAHVRWHVTLTTMSNVFCTLGVDVTCEIGWPQQEALINWSSLAVGLADMPEAGSRTLLGFREKHGDGWYASSFARLGERVRVFFVEGGSVLGLEGKPKGKQPCWGSPIWLQARMSLTCAGLYLLPGSHRAQAPEAASGDAPRAGPQPRVLCGPQGFSQCDTS